MPSFDFVASAVFGVCIGVYIFFLEKRVLDLKRKFEKETKGNFSILSTMVTALETLQRSVENMLTAHKNLRDNCETFQKSTAEFCVYVSAFIRRFAEESASSKKEEDGKLN